MAHLNSIIASAGAFLAAVVLVMGLTAPTLALAPNIVRPRLTPQKPQLVVNNPDTLEARKTKIAQHLSAKYKQSYTAVKTVVDLAWHEADKQAHVTPELVLAVIQKESGLHANASSGYGAKGYMQVVKRFHKEKLGRRESLQDPAVNIRVGTQILQEYAYRQKGNLREALAKYSGNAAGYAQFVLNEARALKEIT